MPAIMKTHISFKTLIINTRTTFSNGYNAILLFSLILGTALAASSCSNKESIPGYVVTEGFAQGSTYRIIYHIPGGLLDDSLAFSQRVEDSISLWFKRIDHAVSGYNRSSEISMYNSGLTSNVGTIFADIFEESFKYYKISGGLFDPSAAPLFDLWGFGFKNDTEPSEQAVDSVKAFIGMDKLSLKRTPEGAVISTCDSLAENVIQLNFNAIAQGYTADYFGKGLGNMGIEDYLVEIGGEMLCKGVNSKGEVWKIGVDKPIDGNNISGQMIQAVIAVSGKGIVTSGNYRKFYIKDGQKYSHTINPLTGYPVTHSLLSATVIAPNSTQADAYATMFMVMGLDESKKFLETHPELDALLVYQDGEKLKQFATIGLDLH